MVNHIAHFVYTVPLSKENKFVMYMVSHLKELPRLQLHTIHTVHAHVYTTSAQLP